MFVRFAYHLDRRRSRAVYLSDARTSITIHVEGEW